MRGADAAPSPSLTGPLAYLYYEPECVGIMAPLCLSNGSNAQASVWTGARIRWLAWNPDDDDDNNEEDEDYDGDR